MCLYLWWVIFFSLAGGCRQKVDTDGGGDCPIPQIWYLSNSLANDQSRAFEWTVQEKVSRSFATCTPLPSLTHRGSMYPSPLPPPLWVHVPLSTSSPTVGPSSVYLMSLQVTKSPRPSHSIIRRHPRARNEGEIYMYICPLLTCILRYV